MRIKHLTYFVLAILFASCSANKFLPENEKYFEGHVVQYEGEKLHFPKELENTLSEDLKPKSTRRYLLSRPGAWIFGVMGTPKKDKGLKHWIKYSLGNKPYYLSQLNTAKNESIILSKLKNNGYFRATVSTELDSSEHKAQAVYTVSLKEPYLLDSIQICDDYSEICKQIDKYQHQDPILKQGDLFSTSNLVAERKSITRKFRNEGYYFLSPDFLYFRADSNDGDNKVRLSLELKENLIPGTLKPYALASAQFNLAANSKNTVVLGDSLRVMVDTTQLYIKPKKLEPFIAYQPGKLYSKSDEELTLKQLNKLEVFEFINVQYEVDSSQGEYMLNAILMATPRRQRSIRTEFNLSTTSTNFTGPGLQVEYYDRNIFRGAEKLRLTATGRYETQLSGSRKGLDSYEIDIQASLLIPRVSGPLNKASSSGNVPKTKYRLQFKIYNQPDYYAQASSSASFGYEWLKGKETHNDLRLINLDYVRLLQSSERLEELFDDNVLSRESFEDQVILGTSYSLAHAPKAKHGRRTQFFFGASAEIAGNVLYGINEMTNAAKSDSGQYTFVEVPFAQYARLQVDFRTYINWTKYMRFVMRQNIGVGIPYGNSSALPFSKQFFVGGASSLRGFQPRSIGPGSYINEDYGSDSYFDQSGDILIELNFENRINMGQYLELALFADVGNVWLKNATTERPGGEFKWDTFVSEMAVAGGIGFRLDFTVVLLRLDLAIPLRVPYLPEGERWTIDQISIDKSWRKDNLLWNLAIGYPF